MNKYIKTKLIPIIITATAMIFIIDGLDVLFTTELIVVKIIYILNIVLWSGVLLWFWYRYKK